MKRKKEESEQVELTSVAFRVAYRRRSASHGEIEEEEEEEGGEGGGREDEKGRVGRGLSWLGGKERGGKRRAA